MVLRLSQIQSDPIYGSTDKSDPAFGNMVISDEIFGKTRSVSHERTRSFRSGDSVTYSS